MPAARIRRALGLPLLLLVAVAVRVPHLDWGLPAVEEEAFPAKQAVQMWGFADGRVDWNPGTAGWPALSFYAQLGLQHLHYALGRLTGAYADRLDWWVAWLLDPTPVILWGRALAVALSAGIVAAGALLGRRLAGKGGFWLAGGLLAMSPLLVRHAQLIDPDGWVGLFAALAVLSLVAAAQDGRRRDYLLAGLWIGLGTAAKYTPALLGLGLLVMHAERVRTEGRRARWLGLDDRRPWLAGLVAVLAFVVASPFTLLDLAVLRRDVAWQGQHLSLGHFGHASQGPGWFHYLGQVLPAALGWPALVLGLAGLGVAARRGPRERAVLGCALILLLVLGALQTRFDRYMIPLLVPLAAGAALAWAAARARWPRLGSPVAAVVLVAVLLGPPAAALWRYHEVTSLPGTGTLAAAWLAERVDADREAVLTERYGPPLPVDLAQALRHDPAYARLSERQRARLAGRPALRHLIVPMYSTYPELAAWFYDLRQWTAYDWIITSGGVRTRYLAEPDRFPRQREFYADLERYAPVAVVFGPGEAARGPELRVHRLDDDGRRRLLAERGLPTLAEQRTWYDRAHRPHLLAAAAGAGRAAEAAGRWDEAARWAELLADLAEPAQRPEARQRLAVALLHAGRTAEAEAMFTEQARQPGLDITAWGYLGVLAERRGDPDRAAACYREVVARDPDGPAGALARRRLAALPAARPGE